MIRLFYPAEDKNSRAPLKSICTATVSLWAHVP
jgi:hypothetical protein